MTPTERNAPCPCGSGKKYKKCCYLSDEPARHTPPSGDFAGFPPAANDEMPPPANPVTQALMEALSQQSFASVDDVQAFADQFMFQRNQQPNDDFQGLSPGQMHAVLHAPFDSPQLVEFNAQPQGVHAAPIVYLFSMMVEAIGESGLKATAKGNLPQKFCRAVAQGYWSRPEARPSWFDQRVNREDDFHDLHITRVVAELAKLIRLYRGKFILTGHCRKILKSGGMPAIYNELFRCYTQKFNWAYSDRFPEMHFLQQSFLFTLYLLHRHGGSALPVATYQDYFLRAFPMVLDTCEDDFLGPERAARSCYNHRVLRNFAEFLGLATLTPDSDDILTDYHLTAQPLLYEFVNFKHPLTKVPSG